MSEIPEARKINVLPLLTILKCVQIFGGIVPKVDRKYISVRFYGRPSMFQLVESRKSKDEAIVKNSSAYLSHLKSEINLFDN